MNKLTKFQESVITGLILSDGSLVKRNKGDKAGAYFKFAQTANPNNIYAEGHVELLFFVFNLFSDYTVFPVPNCGWATNNKKIYPYLYFNTVIDPLFTELYKSWYKEGVKTIPLNISSLLDPVALAYWSMGDGGKNGKGFHLNTNAYKTSGVDLLVNGLKTNFDLNCSVHSRNRIYIPSKEMVKFTTVVRPHFLQGFNYKIS